MIKGIKMGKKIMTIARGACNAFRKDGYSRTVGRYRGLGEISQNVQSVRARNLLSIRKETYERTKKFW